MLPIRTGQSALLRYTLFQIPDLILLSLALAAAARWWGLPLSTSFLIVGLWIVKDVLLYPILKVAYQTEGPNASDRLSGAIGIAKEALDPRGYVRVGSELWRAELRGARTSVGAGERVRVIEVRGLELLVEASPQTVNDRATRSE